ncbi:nitric oxide synthase oxygenase [Bacillus sp. MUM 13]|uniref:nitric oxide synthase oxygenase n=1 Tax=Bacillus sp. MUM 13 TaxID=1678001 RepID=UPI0014818948|nr:nitric oxide synthase oxygenase [Bacillus sp. MUM 13]
MLPRAAAIIMVLGTKRKSSLWMNRALIELNEAFCILIKNAGVSIVNHHTAANQLF